MWFVSVIFNRAHSIDEHIWKWDLRIVKYFSVAINKETLFYCVYYVVYSHLPHTNLNMKRICHPWCQLVDELVTNPIVVTQRSITKSITVCEPVLDEHRLSVCDFILNSDPRVDRHNGNNNRGISRHQHVVTRILHRVICTANIAVIAVKFSLLFIPGVSWRSNTPTNSFNATNGV